MATVSLISFSSLYYIAYYHWVKLAQSSLYIILSLQHISVYQQHYFPQFDPHNRHINIVLNGQTMSGRTTYEKQKKRKEALKQLLDEGCVIGENAETADIISTMRNVQHILDQSNQLAMGVDEIDNTTEAVMDAQVLKMSHELIGSAVQNIDSAEFNDQHFVKDILAFLQGAGPAAAATTQDVQMRSTRGSANWIRLSDLAAPLCRSFRWSQCMLGTFEPDTSEVVVSQQTQRQQRAPRTRISEQVKPQHLAQLQAEEKPKQVGFGKTYTGWRQILFVWLFLYLTSHVG